MRLRFFCRENSKNRLFHLRDDMRMKQLPLCVTVAQISGKFLMDVTSEEEICAEDGAPEGWDSGSAVSRHDRTVRAG